MIVLKIIALDFCRLKLAVIRKELSILQNYNNIQIENLPSII